MEPEQGVDAGDADLTWLLEVPEERDFIQRLGPEVALAALIPAPEETPDPMAPGSALEAVPLSSSVKRGLMRVLRRESTVPRGFNGRRCAIRATRRRPNETTSLPAIEVGLCRLVPAPDGPATEEGPG
jgi:hypothetical protein